MGLIVVGVDGSPDSQAALEFALGEARVRSATLKALYAVETPRYGWPGLSESNEVLRQNAWQVLDAAISAAAPATDVEREVVDGNAAEALIAASAGAELVVIGSRGRGGFTGLVVGSVSQKVSQYANCPVAVVRAEYGR